jgi:hypothetical protein
MGDDKTWLKCVLAGFDSLIFPGGPPAQGI